MGAFMRRIGALLVLAFSVLAPLASVAWAVDGAAHCLKGTHFTVAFRERANAVGSLIIAHPLEGVGASACTLKRGKASFAIGGADDALYVQGLIGDILVLDVGTGPDRQLTLYDLSKRREILSLAYDSDAPLALSADAIELHEIVDGASPENCPDYKKFEADGLTAALARPIRLHLPELTREGIGAQTCVARQ